MDDVYFVQQRTFQAWNIRDAEFGIRDIKNDLLFLPAWTGCDSTSAIFGKGKVTIVKLLRKSKVLQHISEVFMNDDSSPDIIIGKASELSFKTTSKTYILSFSTRLYHLYLYIRICVYLSWLRKIKEIDLIGLS